MKAPEFWWHRSPTATALALSPFGAVIGAVASQRLRKAPSITPDIPVICVGNPTVGGAGKTPLALAIAKHLKSLGARPVFLTRGYKGRLRGPLAVKPDVHTATEVGDEPLLLARRHPTVVAKDRAAGAALAQTLGDVIVMDDGFQNPSVAKSVSLLVIDGLTGAGNGLVTPAGPLRAPLAVQLPFADAAVVVGHDSTGLELDPLPRFNATLRPTASASLKNVPAMVFAGIGQPEKVFRSAAALGARVRARRAFPDHHFYTSTEAQALLHAARRHGLVPVTTRKDWVRLVSGSPAAMVLADTSIVMDVEAVPDAALLDGIANAAFAHRSNSNNGVSP